MQNRCAEIKLRAERKAGEMLAASDRSDGGRPKTAASVAGVSAYRAAIESIDLPERTAQRWQEVAAIPAPVFERHITATKDAGEELTTASLMRAAERPHVDASRLQMELAEYSGADKDLGGDGYRAQWRDQDGTVRSNGWEPFTRRD